MKNTMMDIIKICFIQFLLLTNFGAASALDATAILKEAETYRNFRGKPFSYQVKIKNMDGEKIKNEYVLEAQQLNSHKLLLVYSSPARDKNKAILMNEKNMWFHTPRTSKPLRITPQQRLVGEASNGDVANTDFSGDYNATYLKEDNLEGTDCHVLELIAKDKSFAAYKKLHYYVRKDNSKPIKAVFFAPSGKKLKIAHYKSYEKLNSLNGKLQLSAVEIANSENSDKKTIISFSGFKVEDIPANHFQPNYLKRFK